ncbi:hypothetical protein RI367_000891 [Sorochytrium milnesiophthora]
MLQEPALEALLHSDAAAFGELRDFAAFKPSWLQLTLIRQGQMEERQWRRSMEGILTGLLATLNRTSKGREFELPEAVKWFVSCNTPVYQRLAWNTLFKAHAPAYILALWDDPDSQTAVLNFLRVQRKTLRDGLKRKVYAFNADKTPRRALEYDHERWVQYVTPSTGPLDLEQRLFACVLRRAAIPGPDPACERQRFWVNVEDWCAEIRRLRTDGETARYAAALDALVAEDRARAGRMLFPGPLPAPELENEGDD